MPWGSLLTALLVLAGAGAARGQEVADVQVARAPGGPTDEVYAHVLAKELGLPKVGTESVRHRGQFRDRPLEGRGPSVQLEELRITRLLFERPVEALAYLTHLVRPRRTPVVADARGRQLVLLEGQRLTEPGQAARALAAAWAGDVLPAPREPLAALRVASPPPREGVVSEVRFETLTVLGEAGTPAYEEMLTRLRLARQSVEDPEQAGAYDVEFVSTNHFVFRTRTERGESFSEVLMTKEGAVFAVAASSDGVRSLAGYARRLLEALPPQPGPQERILEMLHRVVTQDADGEQ